MKKLWNAIKQNPKRSMLVGALALAVLLPIASNAWGPNRGVLTIEHPADYVVFNSITNNPSNGDERNFVRIKETNTQNNFTNNVNLEVGKKYTVYVYFHNNAASNLNLVANNTLMSTQLPATSKAGTKTAISAKISADNANPKAVWDEVYVTASQDVALKYVSGSATIYSKGAVNGQKLNWDNLATNGALIGYNALDGKVPGCHEFAGYVLYDFVVEPIANFTIAKTVSKTGEMKFSENVTVADNQVVDFKLVFTNTGAVEQKNVVIKDILPAGMTYVAGSAKLSNAGTGNKPVAVSDNIATETGINIGNYLPGGNAFILFSAKLNDLECGKQITLENTARAISADGSTRDTASVTVTSEVCTVKDIQVCEIATKRIITIKEDAFNSSKHDKDLSKCSTTPVVNDIRVCDLDSKQIITIKETAFNSTKHSKDLSKCSTTPTHLPQTGPAEVVAQLIGLVAIVASTGYYLSSRKLAKQ